MCWVLRGKFASRQFLLHGTTVALLCDRQSKIYGRRRRLNVHKKFLLTCGALALAALAAGCSDTTTSDTTTNANATTTTTATTTTAEAARTAPDDSEIVTTNEGGVTTETRTFRNTSGRVQKVVVTTRDGKRTARVHYRSGEVRDLPDDKVADALDATGDALG